MSDGGEAIKLLTEIRDLLRQVALNTGKGGAARGKKDAGMIAPDSDLDSKYGDPQVFGDPKFWQGPTMVGKRYSECPSDYLQQLAGLLEWKAGKSEEEGKTTSSGKPVAPYQRQDAARARGWAERNKGKAIATDMERVAAAQGEMFDMSEPPPPPPGGLHGDDIDW